MTTLAKDIHATGIHGVTGRPYVEGTLEAGTLVRNVVEPPEDFGPLNTWHFEASTDGGKTWYKQRSKRRPETR